MRVGAITVYPVKSMRGSAVDRSDVELAGLRHDRRWMVVDAEGENITARTHPVMLSIAPHVDAEGSLTLDADGRPPLRLRAPTDGPQVDVTLSRVPWATGAGDEADAWISAVLGEPARLVWLDDPMRRGVGFSHGGRPGDPLSLADAGPLLLTTVASLNQLAEWIAAEDDAEARQVLPLSGVRFRPSVVVEGDVEPFAEDRWERVQIGDIEYRFAEHCDRCVMTTIDPETRVQGKEPIRTLSKYRRWEGAVWFGVRLIPMRTGQVSLGDPVTVG
jgi:uncharacterized protein YcbX